MKLHARVEGDAEAIQIAASRRVSGAGGDRRHMGMGLAQLQDFSDAVNGEVRILSGSALLRRRVGPARTPIQVIATTAGWDGAVVCLDAVL